MLRSVLVTTRPGDGIRHLLKLALGTGTRLTIVERSATVDREHQALVLLHHCGRMSWVPTTRRVPVIEHARSAEAELVVTCDPGVAFHHITQLMGDVPVLLSRSMCGVYKRPLLAFDSAVVARQLIRTVHDVLPAPLPRLTALRVSRAGARESSRVFEAAGTTGPGWTRYVRAGDPRTAIAHVVGATGADLVVLGTRRRWWLTRLLFGSVGCGIASDVASDVLFVPIWRHPCKRSPE